MKLLYIISMAHSGSTLVDCILGTHPQICSSGEMQYLGWQLERTKNKTASVNAQDICTCEKNFRDCIFWSKVIAQIEEKTDIALGENPRKFDTALFGRFAYKDQIGYIQKVKGYIVRNYLERGYNPKKIKLIDKKIEQQVKNIWLLYETMSHVSQRSIIVDSSKHLTRGLLIQQSRPKDVFFLFIHRDIYGLASSAKRRKGVDAISKTIRAKKKFEVRINLYKKIFLIYPILM